MGKNNYNSTVSNFISNWVGYFRTLGIKREDIIIDDIYNLGSVGGGTKTQLMDNKPMRMEDIDPDVKEVVQGISQTYDENIKVKEEMLTKSRELYETTAVQTIVDVSLDDGFNNFKEDKDFVISYEPNVDDEDKLGEDFIKKVQDEIDDFADKSGIKDIVADIVPEIIRDGEHALAIRIEQGKGVTGINDDIDVKDMLPYYRGNNLAFVLEKTIEEKGFSQQERLRLYNPDNIIFFRLKHFNKKKLNLDTLGLTNEAKGKFKKELNLSIPKYIRICLPLYYSALDDIETLQTMEKLASAQDFVNLMRSQIIGIGVPANTTSEDAKKVIREYERHLNEVIQSIDTFKDMTVDQLVSMAGNKKLLPNFSDGKGSVTPFDLGNNDKTTQSRDSVAAQRNQVALTTGFPTYYFTNSETPQEKAVTMKLYSRYTKKLTALQVCAAEGTEEIVYRHLKAKNMNVKRSAIKVRFKSLTNGDVLDDVDVLVATVTGLADMYDALEKIASSENNDLVIDSDKLQEIWDIYTSNIVNIQGLLKKDENKFANPDEDMGDYSGFSGGPSRPSGLGAPSAPRGGEDIEEPESPETELSPSEENAIDRSNAEMESDFVNSTSAEI